MHPVVTAVTQRYRTGVTLSQEAMTALERRLIGETRLGKWFLSIAPEAHLG